MKNREKFGNIQRMSGIAVIVAATVFSLAACTPPDPVVKVVPEGMVWVEGGSFDMGTPGGGTFGDEEPVHSVTIGGFYMGKTEVTQARYEEVMGSNPSHFQGESRLPAAGEIQANRPVEYVSWYDAVDFCNRLSEAEGLEAVYTISGRTPESGNPITGAAVTADFGKNGYRLPTEAEWEYAARGGNRTPGDYEYSGSDDIDGAAWTYENSVDTGTHEAGKKAANGLGLYDMSGNVWEWCWDWYAGYASEAQTDPAGASSGADRVQRGGSWGNPAEYARSASRSYENPSYMYSSLGFRVVRLRF